ncbi:hypothetical protein AYO38_04145 [bacterium SCGC AG-212-C10]|nr:hypothetical protein AYO38_04145 [bacterium SCGC AG-212-C10]
MDQEHEHAAQAADFTSRAASITEQADRSIYSDDPDAIARLRERIEALEAERARRVAINAEIRGRKLKPDMPDDARVAGISAVWAAMACTDQEKRDMVNAWRFNGRLGYPSYAISNLTSRITKQRQRLALLAQRSQHPTA